MSYRLIATLATAVQQLAADSEAAASTIRCEILTPEGDVVASIDNGPFDFPGLQEGDYVFRASGLDSDGAVMGVPYEQRFTANDSTAAPADPGAGGLVDVELPAGATLTLSRE